jgi:peptide/nickel transport system permease protein
MNAVLARPGVRHVPAAHYRLRGGLWSQALVKVRRNRLSLAAAAGLGTWLLLAAAADVLAAGVFGSSFQSQDLRQAYARPSLAAPNLWLGADELGRSQIVRLLHGARVSFAVSGAAVVLIVILGVAVGLASGYFRGWIDDLTQWIISTLQAIPRLVLLVALSALFAPGPQLLVLVMGLLSWPRIAAFVRGQTLALRQREFVVAARVVGASHGRLMMRHLLPNIVPFVCTLVAIELSNLILVESALSFLGLGIQPPLPSWGNMLSNAATSFTRGPWLVYCPALAISFTVLCLFLLGDALRDALDPRHTGPCTPSP